MRLLLGTKNLEKIREIRAIFADLPQLGLITIQEHPFADVVEDGTTFAENACKKARMISQKTELAVLAEDSGLEVEALGGRPGVHSALLAGAAKNDRANIAKLLRLLEKIEDRQARLCCVAVLHLPDAREFLSEGRLEGRIAARPRGRAGFGYDPVFIPDGYEQTLAELGAEIKNQISHRRRALEGLKTLLKMLCSKCGLEPSRRV